MKRDMIDALTCWLVYPERMFSLPIVVCETGFYFLISGTGNIIMLQVHVLVRYNSG